MEFNRFDVSTKELVWDDPLAWLSRLGIDPNGPVEVIDSDVTVLTAEEKELPGLVREMADRINILEPTRAAKLWTASYLLMGLRYPDALIANLLEGVQTVQDSTTYQKIIRDGAAQGRITEARRMLLRQGTKRFGSPDAATLATLEGLQDIDRLEDLGDRIIDAEVQGWNDWLGPA